MPGVLVEWLAATKQLMQSDLDRYGLYHVLPSDAITVTRMTSVLNIAKLKIRLLGTYVPRPIITKLVTIDIVW